MPLPTFEAFVFRARTETLKRLAEHCAETDQPNCSQLHLWAVRNSMMQTSLLNMKWNWMLIGFWFWKYARLKWKVWKLVFTKCTFKHNTTKFYAEMQLVSTRKICTPKFTTTINISIHIQLVLTKFIPKYSTSNYNTMLMNDYGIGDEVKEMISLVQSVTTMLCAKRWHNIVLYTD